MTTSNETQADIIAEMRQHIQAARDYPQDIEITTGDVEDWADRIEAAAVRDIRAERTEAIDEALAHAEEVRAEKCRNCERAPGNAAALRAALEAMLDEYCDLCDVQNQMTESGHNCSWRNRWSGCQSKAIDKASAALSAPAMNCGRFTNAESAIAAFRVETGIGEKPLALWLGHDIEEFAAWFFAMASQKRKEKSDGSK